MKIAVIGAGAIGGLVAGYLAKEGQEVVLVAHSAQCNAIEKNGLNITGVRGSCCLNLPVKMQLDENVDLAILATKTQGLKQAVTENLEYLKPSYILTVQNGIRAEKIVSEILGKNKLFASIVMFGATYLEPGKVVHNFEGDWILGPVVSGAEEDLAQISKITSKIFPSPITNDIMSMKWLKVFINANNCLPAILGESMQETFSDLNICKISLGIWQEGWRIVNKSGTKLAALPNFPLDRITGLISMPLDQSAKIFSGIMMGLSKEPLYGSILQSIKRGRPSEIDYINGEFTQLAQNSHQEAPLNGCLVEMVHRVEKSKKFLSKQELINQTKEFVN